MNQSDTEPPRLVWRETCRRGYSLFSKERSYHLLHGGEGRGRGRGEGGGPSVLMFESHTWTQRRRCRRERRCFLSTSTRPVMRSLTPFLQLRHFVKLNLVLSRSCDYELWTNSHSHAQTGQKPGKPSRLKCHMEIWQRDRSGSHPLLSSGELSGSVSKRCWLRRKCLENKPRLIL